MKKITAFLILIALTQTTLSELKTTDPTIICSALESSGLTTTGWKDSYGYRCLSSHKDLSSTVMSNNITYYAEGNKKTVTEAKIVLTITNRNEAKYAHKKLLEAGNKLSQVLTGQELYKPIVNAIEKGNPTIQKVNQTTVEVFREDYPNNKFYDLKVIFK